MWIAHYKNGRELKQFGDGKEALFKDIEQDELKTFEVRVKNKWYSISLEDGSFQFNGEQLSFENFGKPNEFQLVYFKRIRRNIGPELPPVETLECFGWKTNIDGHTFKRILKVTEDGGASLSLK